MQNHKQAALAIAFLTILLTAGLSSGYAELAREPSRRSSRKEAILVAFENNDYHSWKKAVTDQGGIAELVSKRDFDLFFEARAAARQGQYDQAISLAQMLEERIKGKLAENYLS